MNYSNWKIKPEDTKEYFEQAIRTQGKVTIYTVLDHVSKSGMTRYITAYIILNNQPICLAREYKVGGCGMDMGFSLAYDLYTGAYDHDNEDRRYQDYLEHHWL